MISIEIKGDKKHQSFEVVGKARITVFHSDKVEKTGRKGKVVYNFNNYGGKDAKAIN